MRGSRTGNRPFEPQPKSGRPSKPKRIAGEDARVWKQVIKQLEELGTLHKTDSEPIARYCELLVRYATLNAWIKKYGETYTRLDDKKQISYRAQHPEVGIINKMLIELRRLEQEFGLTPSSRSKLQIIPQGKTYAIPSRPRCKAI